MQKHVSSIIKIASVGAIVLLLGVHPIPSQVQDSAYEARQATRSGDHARAAELYHTAYAYQPWAHHLLASAARAEIESGNYPLAAYDLERLAEIRPLTPDELALLGLAYSRQGQVDKAVELWGEAYAAGATVGDALEGLLTASIRTQDWQQAREILTILITQQPGEARYRYQLGLIQALDNRSEAATTLAQAVGLNPERYAKQLEPLQRYLEEPPTNRPDIDYFRLGRLYLVTVGEYELAEAAFSRAADYFPANPWPLAYLGYTRALLGEPGLGATQQALAIAPGSPELLLIGGLTFNESGDPYGARQLFREAYAIDPGNPALPIEIAGTYRATGVLEIAEQWMLEAVAIAPDDPRLQILLVQFYVDAEYMLAEKGLPLAQQLVADYPQNAEAHDALGWAYYQLEQTEAARQSLMQAVSLDPTLARAHMHLGAVYESLGDGTNAIRHYEQAIQLDPYGPWGAAAESAIERMRGST